MLLVGSIVKKMMSRKAQVGHHLQSDFPQKRSKVCHKGNARGQDDFFQNHRIKGSKLQFGDRAEKNSINAYHAGGGKSSSVFSTPPRLSPIECIVPRSKAEADILGGGNQTSRHRQLPCRTYISTGFCPYKDRCVYLHDPRVQSTTQVSYGRL